MATDLACSFTEHFSSIQDPRTRPVEHLLHDILFLSVCATIAGADGPSDIEEFGVTHLEWLRRYVPMENGVPSHDTIGRIFALIKPKEFQEAFLSWIDTFTLDEAQPGESRLVPIDGKTLRGSGTNELSPLHAVSAWASAIGVTLGQVAVDKKSNEIKAIPELLRMLELRGAIVTIDAMGCQKEIAKDIVQDGGDYILAVKENQPKLHAALESFFDDAVENDFETGGCRVHETQEKSRGREETRQFVTAPLPEEMTEFKKEWRGLDSIGRAMTMVERDGEMTADVRYYILSIPPKVKTFAAAVRGHWSIENSLHWVLDVTFKEDASQIRIGYGPENFGFLRRFVISLLRQDTSEGSLRRKRKRAGWDTNFLEKVLKII
jgi:predicted transposase YbfD/YdcC